MRFNRFGLTFDHPDNWTVDTEDSEGRFATVTVYSPGGAFWSVSGHTPGGDPQQLAAAVVAEMKQEYQERNSIPSRPKANWRATDSPASTSTSTASI